MQPEANFVRKAWGIFYRSLVELLVPKSGFMEVYLNSLLKWRGIYELTLLSLLQIKARCKAHRSQSAMIAAVFT